MDIDHKPLVSILIPLYNQEHYFKACIKSVEKQTYKNLEIIIVNDGSTDRSPQMARDWAACDSRVKVIDKQNEGLAFARRDAYLAATGEFIAFVDSDDMLAPKGIEIMLSYAVQNEVDLVLGSFDYRIGPLTTRRNVDKGGLFPLNQVICQPELFDKYFEGFFNTGKYFPVMVWGKLYRKSIFDVAYEKSELFSADVLFMGEDLNMNMNLFPHLGSMYRTEETVYYYRQGGGTFGFNKRFPQVFVCADKRLKLLDHFDYRQGYEPLFAEYVALVFQYTARLIHYKKADKQEITAFFEQEYEQRETMKRLLEYYSNRESKLQTIGSLKTRDFDGLYQYACSFTEKLYGSFKIKVFRSLVKFMDRLF